MSYLVAQETNILIRHMEGNEQDLQLFLQWMTNPQTMPYWSGTTEHYTAEKVAQEYQERLHDQVEQCIITYDGLSIGYCQFYRLNAEDYEVPETQYAQFVGKQTVVYGIDLFLGEEQYRNHGIGTMCLRVLCKALFERQGADMLLVDPKISNVRAIRCYHKCGFRDLFVAPHRELQDGVYHDNLIMGIRKTDF